MSKTTFFFAPPENFDGDLVSLPEDEAHHATRVLRLRKGDLVEVVDGIGGWHSVELLRIGKDGAAGRVVERRLGVGETPFDLRVGIGLVKNRSRLETAVEKATELGVNRITLLRCHNTEDARAEMGRLERVAKAAVKQSLRSVLPLIEGPTRFEEYVEAVDSDIRILCDASDDALPMTAMAKDLPHLESCDIAVGPEGGFSLAETEYAVENGWVQASLGTRRLRTETAVIVACGYVQQSLVSTLSEDLK